MKKDDVIQFLGMLSAENVTANTQWISCSCILAPWTHDSGRDSNPSFAIRVSSHGESYYNCFTCGNGSLLDLLDHLDEFGAQRPKYKIKEAAQLVALEGEGGVSLDIAEWGFSGQKEIIHPYPEVMVDQFPCATKAPMPREYLHKRGIPDKVIQELDIRWDLPRKTVVFPIRDFDGLLVGLRGRYVDPAPNMPKYHAYKINGMYNKTPWYGEAEFDPDKTVVMVESVFDRARVIQFLPRSACCVAPLSVGISASKAERLDGMLDIVTLFDCGVGGNRARDLVKKHYPDSFVRHVLPPENKIGLNGGPADDPGNMTDDQLNEFCQLLLTI